MTQMTNRQKKDPSHISTYAGVRNGAVHACVNRQMFVHITTTYIFIIKTHHAHGKTCRQTDRHTEKQILSLNIHPSSVKTHSSTFTLALDEVTEPEAVQSY